MRWQTQQRGRRGGGRGGGKGEFSKGQKEAKSSGRRGRREERVATKTFLRKISWERRRRSRRVEKWKNKRKE